MDIDPDNGDSSYEGDCGHGVFRSDAGRKRKIRSSPIDTMANTRRQRAAPREETDRLRKWTNHIKQSHQDVQSTFRDNATALLVIFNLMLEDANLTQTEAVTKASRYLNSKRYMLNQVQEMDHQVNNVTFL